MFVIYMAECKNCGHEHGWLSTKAIYVFAYNSKKYHVNLSNRGKFLVRCNRIDCKYIRNAYLTERGFKFGKIRRAEVKEWEKIK